MLLSNSMSVQRVPIDELKPAKRPIRHHSKKQRAKIQKSVDVFGQVAPIPVTPKGEIIDLQLVWRTLKESGATHVNVIVIADKSPAEIKALRLMLNRSAQDGVWDDENLRAVFQELIDLNFDLELTGFDPPEIDYTLNLDFPQANVEENASDIPRVETRAVSWPGSIWTLGDHRLGCGNATDLAFVQQVLAGRLAHVSFIDPSYNIPVHGFVSGKGRNKHREFVRGSGELSSRVLFAFFKSSLDVLKVCSVSSALIYACIDWQHILEMTVAGRACDMPLYQIATWVKSSAGTGGIYRNASEFIAIFRAGKDAPLDNVELGRRGRNRTNVWHYPSMSAFGKDRDDLHALHPTVKPIAMMADVLRDVTRRSEVVLDSFIGPGTSIMAAQETGRVCCGVELDPLYVDVAIRRWQNLTGRDAVLVESDESFDHCTQRLLEAPSGVK
jgi:hypothetical protein